MRKPTTEEQMLVTTSLAYGEAPAAIAARLMARGWKMEEARAFVASFVNAERSRSAAPRHPAPRVQRPAAATEEVPESELDAEFRRALVWFVGGVALTAVTYLWATSGNGGGTYLIAWGPIAYGTMRLLRVANARPSPG